MARRAPDRSRPSEPPIPRPVLFVIVLALALLCAEGALSLAGIPGLAARMRDDPEPRSAGPMPVETLLTDRERLDRTADDGLYAEHADPRVRYTLRPDATLSLLGETVRTNALGLRERPAGPAPEDALRVVVLGDSVAFGYGVADDETLAARLELHLAAARGADARPVACSTVAVPSWNHRAAVAALVDHWDAHRPDIVVYLPVHNDLSDANAVLSTGQMRLEPDPTSPSPWLVVDRSRLASLEATYAAWLRQEGRRPDEIQERFGPCALEADLTPESSRRYDENAASILALDDRARARGARLLVVHSAPTDYAWHLLARLAAARPELPTLLLERTVPVEHTLVSNNHPSAATLDARALWLAEDLLARGWVDPGAGRPLPRVPAAYAALRMHPLGADELAERSEAARQEALEALHEEVDLRSGRGLRQLLGGINPDTTAGMELAAVLRAEGPDLELRLAALPTRPDLAPLAVDVLVDGQPIRRVELPAGAIETFTLPLPPGSGPGAPIEVRLRPETWCVVQDRGRSQVASFQPVRLACPPSRR